jgi:hypothetical protein
MIAVVAVLALVQTGGVVRAADESSQELFYAENGSGRVWANIRLVGQRLDDAYLPIVIGIVNTSDEPVEITRDRIWLSDVSDIIYTMPTVKQLRKGYSRVALDRRAMSTAGIPWEVWVRSGTYESSNFFPDMRARRGNNTVRDRITLRKGHGMIDLFYFERPRNLAPGSRFLLEVHAKGWEQPIRMFLEVPSA